MTASCAAIVLMLSSVASAQQEDLDCSDFGSQAEAQAALREDPSDPYGLDGPTGPVGTGEPGVACEGALPGPIDFTPVANEGGVPGSGVTGVPASSDRYGTIPTPQPSTPVEGPPSGENDVSVLPDTGGLSGLVLMAGVLLLGSGLLVRHIIR